MSFDYDLVVIGSSLEGIYAAKKAVLLQARVALVTQSPEKYLNLNSVIYSRCLQEITHYTTRFNSNPWGIFSPDTTALSVSWEAIKNTAKLIQENITAENSLEELAVLGVDVIYGEGEFCRLPKQAFLVNNRQLRSRNFLLATGATYTAEYDYQTLHNRCFTPDSLWQQDFSSFPKSLVIIGGDYRNLELAQGLARLGTKITFVTLEKQLLPQESIEANRLFLAQFAADKISVLTDSNVQKIESKDQKIALQINNVALETDAIIIADAKEPNVTGLNLAGVKVDYSRQKIIVNSKLQTTNKAIYACGDLLGECLLHTAQYEVDIALKNMLSFPWFSKNYSYLPKIILTQPNFARVGLAKVDSIVSQQKLYVVTKHFKSVPAAQIKVANRGWCQVIIKENGEILGCTIIGDRAIELINIICLMMRHKIKLHRNPIQGLLESKIPYVTHGMSEILNLIAIDFHQQKLQRDRSLKRRLETWFSWRK